MSAPPQQPLQSVSAFADSDEDNASMDTSDLKSGDIDLDDDTENDDEEDDDNEDEEAIPVASIVASGSLSDDDDADDDDEKEDDTPDGAAKLSSKASADGKKITTDNNNNEHPSSPLSSSGKRKASNDDGQQSSSAAKKQRQPAAKGLFVPFRTVKKIMQQDPDINIIQNDAAIMVTAATGMFLKQFTEKSLESCKKKGRNTIKYDDVAEVRAKNKNYAFLDMLLP